MIKIIRTLSRIILGVVFIFSGFVKAIDPLGFAYKLSDYFKAFHMEALESISLSLAIILSSLEFIIGFNLLLGIRMKLAARLVTLFMVFFTLLTLYSALKNPVSDCGCFGDALILTNWQTFYKNLILMVFTAIVFFSRDKFMQYYTSLTEWMLVVAGILLIVGTSFYCIRHLPIIDFRPYHVGTYIPEKMIIPDDAPQPKYITYLYYEKNGEVQEFVDPDYPWDDTTWTFVDSRSEMIDKGYQPPIHDFSITSLSGEDITDMVLNDKNYSFLLVSYDVEKADKEGFIKFKQLYEQLGSEPDAFYCLTSSPTEYIERLRGELNLPYNFFTTDEITLKTILRSNPGLVLLKEGMVVGKWHCNDIPDAETFKGHALGNIITGYVKDKEGLKVMNLLLYVIMFLSIFKLMRQFFLERK